MTTFGLNAFSSAGSMLRELRAREISAVELLTLHIRRIAQVDRQFNSIVVTDYERARRDAAEADAQRVWGGDAPLLGLPITVKESIDVQGLPTTAGVPGRMGHIAEADAMSVHRLRAAGAVIVGKTNVCTWLADFQADNPIYGRTCNPWDTSRTCGGSSGGSAALAAGLTTLDLGSDMGGSIRIPAAFCGLYGHKPSDSLVPCSGHFPGSSLPNSATTLAAQGPLARSAADLELMLSVLMGADVGYEHAWRATLPPPRWLRLSEFRVAVLPRPDWLAVDPEIMTAQDELVSRLAGAGARVAEVQPPELGDMREYYALFRSMMAVMTSLRMPPEQRQAAIADKLSRQDVFQAADARGIAATASEYILWHERRERYRDAWRAFFENWDVVLAPASLVPAFEHATGPTADRRINLQGTKQEFDYMSFYPAVATLCGHPSTTFPAGLTRGGLPIGLQVIGPFLEDFTAIRFAELVEREFGGFAQPPKLSANFW